MSTSPATDLRAALIAAIKADSGVKATAMGANPRVVNRTTPNLAFPFIVVSSTSRPADTSSFRAHEHEVSLHLEGEAEGDQAGEAIFFAIQRLLRDWAPQAISATHVLSNIEWKFEDVHAEEGGKRYYGLQRWRALTEEL